MRKKTLVKNTLILTLASVITRALGFVYRVYLANTIGALGMGLYGLITPIYVLCWALACSGFNTTISKEVSSYNAKGDTYNQRRVLKLSSLMSVTIGTISSLILYIFASFIAKRFYMDEELILPIKVLSFSVPFMALGSCIRGYFLGIQNTAIPALSQLLEQIVRMSVVFVFSSTFIPLGQSYAVTLCILGIVVSEIVSCFFVLICYKKIKIRNKNLNKSSITALQLGTSLFLMALPLTLNKVSGSLLGTIEHMLIPIKLQEFGLTQTTAIENFGKITGMTIPIIYFPSALLTSISISLVPAISESISIGDKKSIDSLIRKSIKFTVITGCFAGAIFSSFSKEIGILIFNQDLSKDLFIFGLMCPLLYMQMITGGILNGLSEQLFIFKNSLISSIIVIFFIYFFMPIFGLDAFLVGLFVSAIITNTLALSKISDKSNTNTKIIDIFYLPVLSAILAFLSTRLIYRNFIIYIFNNAILLIVGMTILSVLYFALILITGAVSISDLNELKPRKKR